MDHRSCYRAIGAVVPPRRVRARYAKRSACAITAALPGRPAEAGSGASILIRKSVIRAEGCARGRAVSELARCTAQRRGLDPEPGAVRHAVALPHGVRYRVTVDGQILRAKRRRRAPAESSRGVPGPLGCNPHFRKHRVCRKIRACRNHHRIVSDCPPGLLPAGAAVISQTGRRSWRAMRGCSTRSRATRRSTARPMPPRSRAGARR